MRCTTADEYAAWRETLAESLSSNAEKRFSRRNPALARNLRSSTFPDTTVLQYYRHPVVSTNDELSRFAPSWDRPDPASIAMLSKELFKWDDRSGMIKFMRSFTPGYLLWTLLNEYSEGKDVFIKDLVPVQDTLPVKGASQAKEKTTTPRRNPIMAKGKGKPIQTTRIENFFKPVKKPTENPPKPPSATRPTSQPAPTNPLIIDFHGARTHASTNTLPEIRLSYIPSHLLNPATLPFTLTPSSPHRPFKSPVKRSTRSSSISSQSPSKQPLPKSSQSPSKRSPPESSESPSSEPEDDDLPSREPKWFPDQVQRQWIPRIYVEKALPRRLAEWEEKQRIKKSPRKKIDVGAMDAFVRRGRLFEAEMALRRNTARGDTVEVVSVDVGRARGLPDVVAIGSKSDSDGSEVSTTLGKGTKDLMTSKKTSRKKENLSRMAKGDGCIGNANPSTTEILTPSKRKPPNLIPNSPAKSLFPTTPKTSQPRSLAELKSASPSKDRFALNIHQKPSSSTNFADTPILVSDSDSDSLPSPSQLVDYLLTPRKVPKKNAPKEEAVRVNDTASPVRVANVAGFRESLGGTFYEVEH